MLKKNKKYSQSEIPEDDYEDIPYEKIEQNIDDKKGK